MDRRLQNAREKIVACGELLETSGWCVAVRMDNGTPWIGPNARRSLTGMGMLDAEMTWEAISETIRAAGAACQRQDDPGVRIWKPDGAAAPGQEARLTKRESEILSLLRMGKTNPEIAIILGCARRTAEKHVENVYRKLGVGSRISAMFSGAIGNRES